MIRGEFHSLAVHIEIGDLVSSKMAFVEGAAVQIQVAVAERRERVPNQKLNPLVEGRAAILFLFATDQEKMATQLQVSGQRQVGLGRQPGRER